MNFKNIISPILISIVLIFIQIMFLKNLAFFGVAFCFIYLLGILNIPISFSHVPLILVSFILGLVIDVFYDTLGMHTASATLLGFLRPYWLKAISPTGGYDDDTHPNLYEMGLGWYISYTLPMILTFSIAFFICDGWGSGQVLNIMGKSSFSAVFTVIMIIITQLLFFERRKGIR